MNAHFPATHTTLSVSALAEQILPLYGLNNLTDFKFLNRGLNDTYSLTAADGDKYILRVYRAGWRTLSDISHELDLLLHLHGQEIPVSYPLPTTDGQFKYIHTLTAAEGTRYAVLFTYAPGNLPSYKEGEEKNAFAYGKAAARLHNAMDNFESEHQRFPLDIEHLIDTPLATIGPLLSHREEDWQYLQDLANRIKAQLKTLPLSELEEGYCHGDFHGWNAHFAEDGIITFYDFDCGGWGWRAYDIAVFLWSSKLNGDKNKKEIWESFIKGYGEERTLNEIDLRASLLFVGIRHYWLLGLHTGNGQDWGYGFMNDPYFDRSIKFFKGWEEEYFQENEAKS